MFSPVRLASRDRVVSPPRSAMVSSSVSARSTDWMLARSGLRRGTPPAGPPGPPGGPASGTSPDAWSVWVMATAPPDRPMAACLCLELKAKKRRAPAKSRQILDRESDFQIMKYIGANRPARHLGGPDLGQEAPDRVLELGRMPGHRLGRGNDHLGGRAGLIGLLAHGGDVVRDRLRSRRRHRHIDRDLLGRDLLLLDRGRDAGGCLIDLAHRGADLADHPRGVLGRGLHQVDLATDVLGRLGDLLRQRLHLARHHGEAPPGFAGARRLDGRIERQEIGLIGDTGDQDHYGTDLLARRGERTEDIVGAFGVPRGTSRHLGVALYLRRYLGQGRRHLLGRRRDRLDVGRCLSGRRGDRVGPRARRAHDLAHLVRALVHFVRTRDHDLDRASHLRLELVGDLHQQGKPRKNRLVPYDEFLVALLQELGGELARLEESLGNVGHQRFEASRGIGRALGLALESQSDEINDADDGNAAEAERRNLGLEPEMKASGAALSAGAAPQERSQHFHPLRTTTGSYRSKVNAPLAGWRSAETRPAATPARLTRAAAWPPGWPASNRAARPGPVVRTGNPAPGCSPPGARGRAAPRSPRPPPWSPCRASAPARQWRSRSRRSRRCS